MAYYLALKSLEEMATGISPAAGKTDKLTGQTGLAPSNANDKHVRALAKKIMEDPSFPLMLETARKMAAKYPNALEELK